MLAIPLISAKYKRVFSSAKHLITNSRNRLRADIIKANKCLKSWFRHPQAKAFKQGVNPNVDEQYKEEAAAKAAAKAADEANAIGNANAQEAAKLDDKKEDKEEDKGLEEDEGDKGSEEDKGDEEDLGDDGVKYILIND